MKPNRAALALCSLWLTVATAQQPDRETIIVSLIDRPVGRETVTVTTANGGTTTCPKPGTSVLSLRGPLTTTLGPLVRAGVVPSCASTDCQVSTSVLTTATTSIQFGMVKPRLARDHNGFVPPARPA